MGEENGHLRLLACYNCKCIIFSFLLHGYPEKIHKKRNPEMFWVPSQPDVGAAGTGVAGMSIQKAYGLSLLSHGLLRCFILSVLRLTDFFSQEIAVNRDHMEYYKTLCGCRLMELLVGISRQYLNGIRITRARELLKTTSTCVSQISERVGFADENSMLRYRRYQREA